MVKVKHLRWGSWMQSFSAGQFHTISRRKDTRIMLIFHIHILHLGLMGDSQKWSKKRRQRAAPLLTAWPTSPLEKPWFCWRHLVSSTAGKCICIVSRVWKPAQPEQQVVIEQVEGLPVKNNGPIQWYKNYCPERTLIFDNSNKTDSTNLGLIQFEKSTVLNQATN